MREFTPRPYQSLAIEWIAARDRCALWAGMGMGKTSTTLGVIDLGLLTGETQPTLVIAPLRVARDTWPAEVRKWDRFAHLEVSPVVGDLKERTTALRRDVPIFTTNYEQLPWLIEHLGDRWPFGRIVSDESTKLKNTRIARVVHPKTGKPYWRHAGGQRSRALGRKSHRTPKFLELTGTPSPNGVIDLWGQAWHLDMGQRLGYSFEAFTRRWYSKKMLPDGGVQYEPHAHAQAEIQALLGDICLTLDPKDWFDLREPLHNVIRVELPKKARALYRDMEREMFAVIGGRDVEAVNAAAKTMKCLQLANGAAYVDERGETYEVVHDEKLDALESILEEAPGPVLCAFHFKSDRARILRRFPDALDVSTPAGFAAARAGQGRLWLGHPASMGHGLDGLQEHCHTAAIFGHWWDLEQRQQFIERIGPVRQAQAGKDRVVTIHHIVARATVDELVIARHESKREVQDLLLEAMKGAK